MNKSGWLVKRGHVRKVFSLSSYLIVSLSYCSCKSVFPHCVCRTGRKDSSFSILFITLWRIMRLVSVCACVCVCICVYVCVCVYVCTSRKYLPIVVHLLKYRDVGVVWYEHNCTFYSVVEYVRVWVYKYVRRVVVSILLINVVRRMFLNKMRRPSHWERSVWLIPKLKLKAYLRPFHLIFASNCGLTTR